MANRHDYLARIVRVVSAEDCVDGVLATMDKIEDGNLGDFCLIRDGILTVEKGACLPPGWNA